MLKRCHNEVRMNLIVDLDEIAIEDLKAYVQMRYRPSDLFDLADHEGWIKCSDRMPMLDDPVLIYTEDVEIEATLTAGLGEYEWRPATLDCHGCGCCYGDYPHPTHWRPRHDPPIIDKGDD